MISHVKEEDMLLFDCIHALTMFLRLLLIASFLPLLSRALLVAILANVICVHLARLVRDLTI